MWPHVCGHLQEGKAHLACVWYFSTVELSLLQELTMKLHFSAFPAREVVRDARTLAAADAETCLYIIERGLVSFGGSIFYPDSGHDSCFGLDMIIHSDLLRDKRSAVSLSYVEIMSLARSDLYTILPHYPLSAATIRNAALRIALKRATMAVRTYISIKMSASGRTRKGSGQNSALSMLHSAFNAQKHGFADSDAGAFFRAINDNKLREIGANGTILETEWVRRRARCSLSARNSPVQSPSARHSPTQSYEDAVTTAQKAAPSPANESPDEVGGSAVVPLLERMMQRMEGLEQRVMQRMEGLEKGMQALQETQRRHFADRVGGGAGGPSRKGDAYDA